MALSTLPTELILNIVSWIRSEKYISSLARTNQRLYSIANPILYQHNIKQRGADGLYKALFSESALSRPGEISSEEDMDALKEYCAPAVPSAPALLPMTLARMRRYDRYEAVIHLFLANGADLESRRHPSGPTILLEALMVKEREPAFWLLIKNGADVNVKAGILEETLLQYAVMHSNIRIIRFLVAEKGLDVDVRDGAQRTPLYYALSCGEEAAARLLIAHGADLNAKNDNGWAPIHMMARNYRVKPQTWCCRAVRILLEAGADVNIKSPGDETALHIAIRYGRDPNLIGVLLDHGCHLDIRRRDGATPLHLAARKLNVDIMEQLIERGANVNNVAFSGETVLLTAAKHGRDLAVQLLVKNGADVYAKIPDSTGDKTVLEYLRDEGMLHLIAEFIEKEEAGAAQQLVSHIEMAKVHRYTAEETVE